MRRGDDAIPLRAQSIWVRYAKTRRYSDEARRDDCRRANVVAFCFAAHSYSVESVIDKKIRCTIYSAYIWRVSNLRFRGVVARERSRGFKRVVIQTGLR